MSSLNNYKNELNSVGWFIPPYVAMGFLSQMTQKIKDANGSYTQAELENALSLIYSPENLAAMVIHRYTITPHINNYSKIIAEAVLAHFSCLDHIAVVGLMPVIEGAGRTLAESRGISGKKPGGKDKSPKEVFSELADSCKEFSKHNNIGVVEEIASMMDSFKEYAKENLYITSTKYKHSDKTNRHGILHGAFSDDDYGAPINFYKAIATIDFLCFISAFQASISWFAPDSTDESKELANYYLKCLIMSVSNPDKNFKPKIDIRSLGALFAAQISEKKAKSN
jgi:hypothetical protein